MARSSEGNGGNGGDGTNNRPTASEGDDYDLSGNPLGLLTLAVSTYTCSQIIGTMLASAPHFFMPKLAEEPISIRRSLGC